MHRRGKSACTLGILFIAIGIMILLAMILPSGFWWFVLAGALIAFGLYLLRSF